MTKLLRIKISRMGQTSFLGLKILIMFGLLSLLVLQIIPMVHKKYNNILKSSDPFVPVPIFHKYNVSCSAIFDLDPAEVEKVLKIRKTQLVEDTDESLSAATSNCPMFLKTRGYDDVCASEEEMDFPIAYSLVVHKYAWMVERLIRTVYSPANIYCIHYDGKSPPEFISAIKSLAQCLPNVFIASRIEVVHYLTFSRLQADFNCFSDLLKSEVQWKYIINLCGQDLPLKTNIELVKDLQKFNGTHMLETTRVPNYKLVRFTYHHELSRNWPERTDILKSPPPHGIEVFVGSAYFILSREFIVFMNSSAVVKDFLDWCVDTFCPDEHFWASIVRIPGVPGEIPRSHPDITEEMSMTRLQKWVWYEPKRYPRCTTVHIHGICMIGASDVRWLFGCGYWFVNKFDPKVDPVAIQCVEEKLEERRKLFGC